MCLMILKVIVSFFLKLEKLNFLIILVLITGLLGTLTTVLCVYLGVHAGRIVQVYKKTNERVIRWTIWFLLTV